MLKMNDRRSKSDLSNAFHIYLMDHKRESDFIEDKLEWVFNFALDVDSDIMRTEPLKYLFEDEDDYDDDLDDDDEEYDDEDTDESGSSDKIE